MMLINRRELLSYVSIATFGCAILAIAMFVGQIMLSTSDLEYPSPDIDIPDIGDIMYFVPRDEAKIEEMFNPSQFIQGQQDLSVGVTSDWASIHRLVIEGSAIAVIIHHAAVDQVNQEELTNLFNNKGLVVAGIGIPGDKLARMLGHPEMYHGKRKVGIYRRSTYYYIYHTSGFTYDTFLSYRGIPDMLREIYFDTLTQEEIKEMVEAAKSKD